LGAHLGHNPSFICGIFASHVLVIGGQRSRVGNSKSILIWEDPWLLRTDGNSYISTSVVQGTELRKVAYMKATQGQSWNCETGIVNALFNDRDK